jgi:cell division protease FtsH
MTRVQMLASSPRPLTDVLVDALRAGGNSLLGLRTRSPDDVCDQHQYSLRLEDKEDEGGDSSSARTLRPDEVAVAILLGQALDRSRDALAKLQDRDTVAIIEVPGEEYVDFVERLFKKYVIGSDAPAPDGDGLSLKDNAVAVPGTVAIFVRRGEDKSRKAAKDGNAEFAAAVQRRCAIIGISAEPDRLLPPHLVHMADHRIILGRLDGPAIAGVIEAITGRHPGAVDDDLAKSATLEALNIAVRADLGAERSLARLRHLVGVDGCDTAGPLLSNLHGLGAAKPWGLALIKDLRDYADGRLSWADVDKGCLLTGAPGTGKTSFARALAREANVHFIATSYSQWQAHRDGHLGSVTQAIRKAFSEALLQSPSILFIDEIDTLPARGSGKWNDDWWTSITNTLLECLDGFERREGVVVIAACNDPARLDPALVRSGRLDRHIEIPLPDVPSLVGILRTHLAADLNGTDLREVALAARGGTGADVERFVREARGRARRAGLPIKLQDLLDAVRNGQPEWPADVRRRVAYHEAGHAIAFLALGIAEPKALSIGGTGGLAESHPGEMCAMTRSHLHKFLVALLAGRAAEQIIFGEATAGAGGSEESDLGRATALATRLETDYGLGAFGLVCIPGGSSGRDLLLLDTLRSAVSGTIDRAYAAALELLRQNQHALEALATALFGAGYLDRADIQAVLVHSPLGTKPAAMPPTAPSSEPVDAPIDDMAIVGAPSFNPNSKNQA